MTDLLKMLHDERATLARRLAGIDSAIAALGGTNTTVKTKGRHKTRRKGWKMDVATKKKLSRLAKLRWAKIKRQFR